MSEFDTVVGLDVSSTATGVAVTHRDGHLGVGTIRAVSLTRGTKVAARGARMMTMADEIFDQMNIGPGQLVVVEGLAFASRDDYKQGAGLWWTVVNRLIVRGIPFGVVPPMTRSAWAVKGGAKKVEVAMAMARLMPEVQFGNDNEVDAAIVALMGAQRIGWRRCTVVQLARLKACEWPPEAERIPLDKLTEVNV